MAPVALVDVEVVLLHVLPAAVTDALDLARLLAVSLVQDPVLLLVGQDAVQVVVDAMDVLLLVRVAALAYAPVVVPEIAEIAVVVQGVGLVV